MAGIQDDTYRAAGYLRDKTYRPPTGRIGLPPLPTRAAEPFVPNLGTGHLRNEYGDPVSSVAAAPDSPWAQFQNDRDWQGRADRTANSIANDRSASRYYVNGPSRQAQGGIARPPGPHVPEDPGFQARIDDRNARHKAGDEEFQKWVDGGAGRSQASPPLPTMIPDPAAAATLPVGHLGDWGSPSPASASASPVGHLGDWGTPDAQAAPVGVPRLPAAIGVRRPAEAARGGPGAPSPLRLHQNRAPSSMAPAAPGPNLPPSAGTPEDEQRAVLSGHFDAQMADALKRGDMNAYSEIAAQKGALDAGGYVGLQNHVNDQSAARARLQEIGARAGLANARSGSAATPEEAAAAAFGKSGSVDMADHAAFLARRSAHQFAPEDAQRIIENEYPSVKHLFAMGADGKAGLDLGVIHDSLKAISPQGFADPKSDFSRAAKARIRQIFGAELPDQLWVPPKPYQSNPYMGGDVSAWMANVANRAWNGHPTFNPATDHARRAAAAQWFNSQ